MQHRPEDNDLLEPTESDEEQQPETLPGELPEDVAEDNVVAQDATSDESATQPEQEEAPASASVQDGATYELREWRGTTMYQCPCCPFNNIELEAYVAYQHNVCRRPECPVEKRTESLLRPTGLLDAHGRPLLGEV